MTDKLPLSKALLSHLSWIRVRIAEYIILNVPSKDVVASVTPSIFASITQVREMVAAITKTDVNTIRLRHGVVDLTDAAGEFGLSLIDIHHGGTIRVDIETRECVNCLDEVGYAEFPIHGTSASCTHDSEICVTCLRTWITTSIENGNWDKITCPAADCPSIMQYADIRRLATLEDFAKYDKSTMRAALGDMPEFKWCIKPGCESGQIHDNSSGNDPIFKCNECNSRMCVLCDREWHTDETCEQVTARLLAQPGENAASEQFIAQNSRKCPGCQSPIEKSEGCDHMTCKLQVSYTYFGLLLI